MRTLSRFALSLLSSLAILSGSAFAQDSAALPQWRIVPEKSVLSFQGTQQGAPFEGRFGTFSGTIAFEPMKPEAGHGTVTVAVSSATTGSPDRDSYIGQDAWFASDKYPNATYTIESFDKNADGQYVAHGRLAIRDVSMPVNLPFTLKIDPAGAGAPATAHIEGATKLKRLDFGVGQGEWKDTSMIGNDIAVKVSVTAVRQ